MARVLVVAWLLATAIVIPLGSNTAQAQASTWQSWASVAWRYFQNCWNPSTGLMDDACGWHYFTFWGLASNIFGVVDAHELGLISDSDFLNRVSLILGSLSSIALDSSTGIPYGVYSRDTLLQATGNPPWDTNAADYGRYLLAMYTLQQHLLQCGFTTQANLVTSDVSRVTGNSNLAGAVGVDLYSYYASLGFMLWGINPSATSAAQSGFQNLMQNGPFVNPSSMYGVSGIPANTKIDGEPFIDAILETSGISQVTGLPSWNSFLQLSQKVYNAQEARSAALSNTPQFWTGGGLDFQPGFVSEWIVWTTGQTWVTLDQNGGIFSDTRLPVAYAKLMFAYNALYGTPYTTNMLTAYSSALQTAIGFEEGIYADGALNKNTQVQTNQIILSSARYMNPSQISTTSTTNVASSSSISNSVSQTTVTVADQTTMTTVTYVSETSLLTILMMSIIIALIFIRVGNRRMVKRS